MRSNNRSVVTEPPYFTRRDIDVLGATPHVVRAPHIVDESEATLHRSVDVGAALVVALGEYRGELRRAIHWMKFRNARWIAVRFGRHLARAIDAVDVVTFVPTTTRRRSLRGHDQSALVASGVARTMRVRFVRTLRRIDSRVQTGSSRAQRLHGPRFVAHARAVRGRNVLLVDDVLTTGSTLRRARSALLRAGAAEVRCVVVAYVKAPPLTRVE
ncbi:MAG: ComF family protein [Ilumatobacteraceae bacterium]